MNPFRLTFRRLRASPGFSLAAIVTLALGIGANSLAFGALHGLVLRPLPFTDADRLVWVFVRTGDKTLDSVSSPEVAALATRVKSFSALAVIGDRALVSERTRRHVLWHGLWVTPGLFAVLDVAPAAGRPFSVDDMNSAGAPAMMLGYERWQQDFNGDPAIVGSVLAFADNKRFTVVGVLPAHLEFPLARPPQSGHGSGFTPGVQDFWVLGQQNPSEFPGGTVLARLTRDATVRRAEAETQSIAAALAEELPEGNDRRAFEIVTLREHVLGALAPALPLLQAFAVLVLLVACGNLANLMMARAMSLETDDAIRAALGATRADRASLLLAESFTLCISGSAVGLLLAWTAQQWLKGLVAEFPVIAARLEMNATIVLLTSVVCAVATVTFAVVGAVARGRTPLSLRLSGAGKRHTGAPASAWRGGLVVVQVTLALALVVGAGLLRETLQRLLTVDTGYQRENVIAADVLLYVPGPQVQAFFKELHPRLRALPGVEAVGLIQSTPLTGKWTFSEALAVEGDASRTLPAVAGNFVAYDYFEAMGIPLLAGRTFTEHDLSAKTARPLVINDVAAQMLFPATNPVGQRVILNRRPTEIVGVVKGTRDVRIDTPAGPQWYEPGMVGGSQIIVRTAGEVPEATAMLRRALLASDPRLIVNRVEPLDAIVSQHVVERRATSVLLDGFALIAFAIAVTGLYALLHLGATERRREFAIRMALGAKRGDVVRMVLVQGVSLATVGVLCGTLLTFGASGVIRHLLFGITATDAATIAAASALVLIISACACLLPAWKAASTDPVTALHQD